MALSLWQTPFAGEPCGKGDHTPELYKACAKLRQEVVQYNTSVQTTVYHQQTASTTSLSVSYTTSAVCWPCCTHVQPHMF